MRYDHGSEPEIRVGLILPEDRISSVRLRLPENVKILSGSTEIAHTGETKIHCDRSNLTLDGKPSDTIAVNGLRLDGIHEDFPVLSPVAAGRRFHWEKRISLKFSGNLEINIKDGYLFAVNSIMLEDYLACVATSEMSPECPAPFLEAQTIAARSWLLAGTEKKHNDLGIDVCNDDCCQRYQGTGHVSTTSLEAVKRTYGTVLTWKTRICDARYSKSCGGILEDYSSVWPAESSPAYLKSHPDSDHPVLTDVESEKMAEQWILNAHDQSYCSTANVPEENLVNYLGAVDTAGQYYRWRLDYSGEELNSVLRENLGSDIKTVTDMKIVERGRSGRATQLELYYLDSRNSLKMITLDSELTIRQALHRSTLYSSAIVIRQKRDSSNRIIAMTICGAGWGHGVGLCQIGALGMALRGNSAETILRHYYPGTMLEKYY